MAQIKNKDEIAKVKKACKITDEIFTKICHKSDLWQMTEIGLRDFILAEIKKRGLKPSFDPIVSGGKNAGSEIHPKVTEDILKGFVIIDFGVIYEKYMSDMTRTIYVGAPTQKEKDLYAQVLRSQEKGIECVMHGEKCAIADENSRKVLGRYAKYFIHTLGHGVGTRIHEAPKIYHKITKPKFKEGMIVTVEPGIYIKNKLGIRIEDTLLVTKSGAQILTKSPKNLIIIKR